MTKNDSFLHYIFNSSFLL